MSIYSPIVTCTSVLTRSRLLFLPRRRLPVAWVCYAAGDMSWQLVDNAANGYVVDDQGSPSLAQGLHYTMYIRNPRFSIAWSHNSNLSYRFPYTIVRDPWSRPCCELQHLMDYCRAASHPATHQKGLILSLFDPVARSLVALLHTNSASLQFSGCCTVDSHNAVTLHASIHSYGICLSHVYHTPPIF